MSSSPITNTDELVGLNRSFAREFDEADLPAMPTRRLAVIACMDSRVDVMRLLGLENGEAHIIRNAGGIITDDVVRSLCLSQQHMETQEVILLHHTDCGVQGLDEEAFHAELEAEVGSRPSWSAGSFSDPFDDIDHSVEQLLASPFVTNKDQIRGFVYDVTTGELMERPSYGQIGVR